METFKLREYIGPDFSKEPFVSALLKDLIIELRHLLHLENQELYSIGGSP